MLDQKIITQEGRRPNPIEHRGIFSFTNTAGRHAIIKLNPGCLVTLVARNTYQRFSKLAVNHQEAGTRGPLFFQIYAIIKDSGSPTGTLSSMTNPVHGNYRIDSLAKAHWLAYQCFAKMSFPLFFFFFQLQILRFLIMANPQKEDGYTAIANEIMEALAGIRISGEEWQCLCHILRKTYGWRKIKDAISLSQFEDSTGIKKQNVCRALNRLLSKKIITIIKKDNGITEYALQKDYETWEPLSKKITLSKKIKPVIKKDKETAEIVIKKDTHKRKSKATITKEKRSREKFSPPCIETLTMEFQKKGITGEAGKREAEKFFNHYESNGWMVGKNKMKSWPASVAGWVARNKERNQNPKQKESTTQQVDDPDDHFEKEVK